MIQGMVKGDGRTLLTTHTKVSGARTSDRGRVPWSCTLDTLTLEAGKLISTGATVNGKMQVGTHMLVHGKRERSTALAGTLGPLDSLTMAIGRMILNMVLETG